MEDGLQSGEAVYWDGTDWPGSGGETFTLGPCQTDVPPHDAYTIDVGEAAPGDSFHIGLRIAMDDLNAIRPTADAGNAGPETTVEIAVFAPSGECHFMTSLGSFADDLWIAATDGIESGTWTLNVYGWIPEDLVYQLRAALIPEREVLEEVVYPDLRIIPPFEISFYVATATVMPGVPTPVGIPGGSCMAEEYEEAATNGLPIPALCLRFSMGLANSGNGTFLLRELDDAPDVPGDTGLADIPLVQVVCRRDGTMCQDEPQTDGLIARYHQTHYHHHYQNAYIYDLYRIDGDIDGDAAPPMEQVGTSGKLGLNPTNEAWEGWDRLYQDTMRRTAAMYADGSYVSNDNGASPTRFLIQIDSGWGDIYDWNRAGNYVGFPIDATGQPVPGTYLIQGTTDPGGFVTESNEDNNQGYALFTVDGLGTVDLLERGYGAHPWDAEKVELPMAP